MQSTLRRYYNRINRAAGQRMGADWVLVGIITLLTLLGLLMAYSTTYFWSYAVEKNPFTIFSRQLMWAVVGTAGMTFFAWLDYGYIRRFAVPIMGVALLSLLVVLLFGDDVFGARRTLFNGSVQPSEIAKVAVIIYAAAWLASRRGDVQSFSNGLLPFGAIIGIVGFFIVLQPDLSTTFVIVIVALTMFFMANASLPQIGAVGAVAAGAFVLLITLFPHSSERLEIFKATFSNPAGQDVDYHIRQLIWTLGGSGLFGHGIGASYQKFSILPTPHTDSVIAVLADEMGLLGLVFCFALFGLFTWRGLHVAQRANTPFGAFMAVGITVWVVVQTLMNVLSVLAMIPFTGVPVPFLSVGGSSLVSLLVACGVLISISRGSRVDDQEQDDDDDDAEVARPSLVRTIRQHGANAFHASAALGRRNSRTRAPRADRPARADAPGRGGRFGQDIRFGARLKRGSAGNGVGNGALKDKPKRDGEGGERRRPVRWRE